VPLCSAYTWCNNLVAALQHCTKLRLTLIHMMISCNCCVCMHAGTGKTVSVIEAILQVLKTGRTSSLSNDNEMWSRREQRPVRILACAPSDAAAGNGGQI
jgi:hypothetical protein